MQGEQETGRVRLEHDAHSHWLGCAAVGPGAAMKDIHWSGISTAPQPFNVYLPFVPRLSMEGPSLADLELLLREIRAYEGLFCAQRDCRAVSLLRDRFGQKKQARMLSHC